MGGEAAKEDAVDGGGLMFESMEDELDVCRLPDLVPQLASHFNRPVNSTGGSCPVFAGRLLLQHCSSKKPRRRRVQIQLSFREREWRECATDCKLVDHFNATP